MSLRADGDIPNDIHYWRNVGSVLLSDDEWIAQLATIRDAELIAKHRNDEMKAVLMRWPRPKVRGCGAAPEAHSPNTASPVARFDTKRASE